MKSPNKMYELGQLIPACEVYIIHNGKVLMNKRAEDKKKFPGFWIGPGGHVDEGEDVLSTAIREVKEETGVEIHENNIKLKVLSFHHHLDRKEVWVEYLFRATIDSEQLIQDSSEGRSEWIDLEHLFVLKNVFPPSKYYFDHILHDKKGIMYSASEWKDSQLIRVLSQRVDTSL